MTIVDKHLLAELAATDWAATRRHLLRSGISSSSIDRRLRSGLLRSMGGGVVGLAESTDPVRQSRRAAILAHPSGLLSHQSAAQLHGLPMNDTRTHLLIPHGGARVEVAADVVFHQTNHLPPIDSETVDQMPTTSPARTLCDLAADRSLSDARLSWLVQWAIKEGVTDRAAFQACVRSMARRGRNGTVRRRQVVDTLLDDEPLALSELELVFLRCLVRWRIDGVAPQFRPPWYDGIQGTVDFAWPELRRIVEVDGRRWHSLAQDQARDRERDRTARANGWAVIRFGWDELTRRSTDVERDLRLFLGHPAPTHANATRTGDPDHRIRG